MAGNTAIHPNSSIAPLKEFDLFVVPPTQTTVEKDIITEHRPLSTVDLTPNSLLQFEVLTAEDEYLRLNELELYLKFHVKMQKKDASGSLVDVVQDDWNKICPANNLFHSMIKQIDVFIGTKRVITTSSTYAYKALLEKKLGFTKNAKETLLTTALYYDDDYNDMEGINTKRSAYIAHDPSKKKNIGSGETLELQDRLHIDLSWQSNLLLGGCKLAINIQFNDSKFYLMASDGLVPSLKYFDSCLICHRAKVTLPIVQAHASGLAISPAKYPFVYAIVKEHTISKNVYEGNWDNAVHGVLPRRVIVGMVSNSAFTGNYGKNPFNFQHFNVQNIKAIVDGVPNPPTGYQLNVDNKLFIKALRGFYQALNQNDYDNTTDIHRDNYLKGNTLFAFDFSPDLSNGIGMGGHANLIKHGSLQIKIKFANALPEAITVLAYCEFDKILEIPQNREGEVVLS